MAKRVETFSFDSEADKDIARWLAGLPSRGKSAAIRAAIREHAGRNGITLGDVYRAVKDLERKLETGAVVVAGGAREDGEEGWDEPADVAAALDALAELGG
jgi:hypothetical protein